MTSEFDTLTRLVAYHDNIAVPLVPVADDVRRGQRRVRRNRGLLTGGVALGVASIAAAAGLLNGGDSVDHTRPAATPTESITYGLIPEGDAPLEPGAYRVPASAWAVADFTITFPEDWTVQYGHIFHTNDDTDYSIELFAAVVEAPYADACVGSDSGELMDVGPGVDDLAAALLEQPGPKASGPFDTTLGGYPAVRIDLTFPNGFDLDTCMGDLGMQIWYTPPTDNYFVLLPDGEASVYIVDIDGERQVFVAQHRHLTPPEEEREMRSILESIHITDGLD